MTNNYKGLIPFCKITHNHPNYDGGKKVIGNINTGIIESNFGKNEILGIENVSIKYGMGFITVDISFPIHQSILEQADISDSNSIMHNLFTLTSTWNIDFGWGGGELFKISGMKLMEFGFEYDSEKKSFITNLTLTPAPSLILKDIKLYMIAGDEMNEQWVRDVNGEAKSWTNMWLTDGGGKNGKYGHTRSLGSVVSNILDRCALLLPEEHSNEIQQTEPEEVVGLGVKPKTKWAKATNGGLGLVKVPIISPGIYTSKIFNSSIQSDIPDPTRIRLVTFSGGKDAKYISAKNKSRFFNSAAIDEGNEILSMLTNKKFANTSVYQFIEELLTSFGYTFFPNFDAVNETGKIEWVIIQSEFNDVNEKELESRGITKVEKDVIATGVGDFLGSFVGSTKNSIFDLHSNLNVVSSIKASTDQGESTIGTERINEAHASGGGSDTDKDTDLENNEKVRDEIFSHLASQAKTIELDCIGLQHIKVADNIEINLAGDLFSGTYKILEVTHSFTDTFVTNFSAVQTIQPGINPSTVEDEGLKEQAAKDAKRKEWEESGAKNKLSIWSFLQKLGPPG